MTVEEQLAEAFEFLEGKPQDRQALLRPLLVKVMSEPDTLRVLGNHALVDHVAFVERVLRRWAEMPTEKRAALPEREEIFLNLTVGRGFEDVEEAYSFVKRLPHAERCRVEEAINVALDLPTAWLRSDGLSLLAVARLLRTALSSHASVEHFAKGGKVAPFLDEPVKAQGRAKGRSKAKATATVRKRGSKDKSWLESFVGSLVHVVVMMPAPTPRHGLPSEPAAVMIFGRCLDVSPNHVVIDIRPGHPEGAEPVLIGVPNIIQMRRVSEASLRA